MKNVNVVAAVICDNFEHKTKVFATQRGWSKKLCHFKLSEMILQK